MERLALVAPMTRPRRQKPAPIPLDSRPAEEIAAIARGALPAVPKIGDIRPCPSGDGTEILIIAVSSERGEFTAVPLAIALLARGALELRATRRTRG